MSIKKRPLKINWWLLPFSWPYGCIVYFRNKLFDWKVLKREEYPVSVICVGNITVGGTGKTPHTEYIVNLLRKNHKVAVLSRGYGRKTSGYILADNNSTSLQIGDEPFQIKHKFSDVMVAVDGNRRRGIQNLLDLPEPPQIIVLDDAFQHRYVKASFEVLLTDYNRLMYRDKLLPAGRLRESVSHSRKADMIIITKCPEDLQPLDLRLLEKEVNPFPYQSLYFTKFIYKKLKPVFENEIEELEVTSLHNKHILLVTGIASPRTILTKLKEYSDKIETMFYSDHYTFTLSDVRDVKKRFDSIPSDNKIIIVTEKDASRLILLKDIDSELKKYLFYLPVEVSFINERAREDFEEKIEQHVKDHGKASGIN